MASYQKTTDWTEPASGVANRLLGSASEKTLELGSTPFSWNQIRFTEIKTTRVVIEIECVHTEQGNKTELKPASQQLSWTGPSLTEAHGLF